MNPGQKFSGQQTNAATLNEHSKYQKLAGELITFIALQKHCMTLRPKHIRKATAKDRLYNILYFCFFVAGWAFSGSSAQRRSAPSGDV